MKEIGRQLFTLAVSAALSWWVFLGLTPQAPVPAASEPRPLQVVLTPVPLATPAPAVSPPAPSQETQSAPPTEPVPAAEAPAEALADPDLPAMEAPPEPPPAELGAPEGEGEIAAAEPNPATEEEQAEPESESETTASLSSEAAMRSEELLEAARAELTGDARPGFSTVLLAAPEEQLDIARFFGEEIVLVPKSALDAASGKARYFRLVLDAVPRIESVSGTAALENYRQYRDLFDYEYARLPDPLRELRRSVLSRAEIYLFGALIPAREWAVVVHRRREALALCERTAAEARHFVLQYRPRARGGFDLEVEEVVFADGTHFRPPSNNSSSHESP